ncbi:MAG: DUF3105 domain-containing protein [Chloroflexi bacterium]|nr:DUF3105 domain-containing protein [Chloroflexota bacterium]
MKKTNRQTLREAKRKKQLRQSTLLYSGVGLAIIVVIVVILLSTNKAPKSSGVMGDEVAIPSSAHVPTDTPPGPYNSNPPAGGAHYATDFPAKFYQESDLATLPKYPQGYLVHSLEHGYVIFWYNCQAPNTDCSTLKQTIQKVMDETGNTKLIAFPWSDMNIPLAMTSWGRILKFSNPDPVIMKQFVERNRYKAPEPDAP